MKKLLVILLLSLPAFSQGLGNLSLKHFQGVPTGNCSKNTLAENDLTGFLYSCDASQSPPQWSTNSFSGICTGAGNCTISGQLTISGGLLSTGNNYLGAGTPNEGTAGTTNGLGAKFVNTGGVVQAKVCATTDTAIPCWPTFAQRNTSTNAINGCTSGCLTGNAYLATTPGSTVAVTFDNTTVVGHYVVASTSAAGQYHDTGSATAPTSNWYLGRAQTAGTGTQTVSIEPQVAGGAAASTFTHSVHTSTSDQRTSVGTFTTNDTSITAGTLTTNSVIEVIAYGTSTTGAGGSSLMGYKITINDGTNTLTLQDPTAITQATTLSNEPWYARGIVTCLAASQADANGQFWLASNATTFGTRMTSALSLPVTLDCTQALTISVAETQTITNSATTNLYSLEVMVRK